ncbi:subclass B3 metallo-beta-lactamase [Geothrix sp. PMB-07]|uniref:subclass B3 metallo-beta-lactamase n=1 Tax=Geothrix sp. PMB-07 TaxID=3068640 RepID=UPI002741A152|nr:subclass B3 metallo-beta-lactamase [Geothrix sp. PMB-07]WLT31873.1 subclass B3 metallo-beta-lactamase [Geothrix sp. PMB-07]
MLKPSYLLPLLLLAPQRVAAETPAEWSKPYPAHRIAENVCYVGTAELGCYLITGSQGHILINTGLADSPPLIMASLRTLKIPPKDIRVLLTNQAHFDHVGGFAEMQKLTGAKVWATAADAPLLRDGGVSDPGGLSRFKAVKVDRVLKDGEVITLGDLSLTVIATPGHTPGSVSYLMTVQGHGQKKTLLFVNLPTVVMPLNNAKYPSIVKDLETSFVRLKALRPDFWVAAHASQCGLAEKHAAGNYEDPAGYAKAVAECEADFLAKLRVLPPE